MAVAAARAKAATSREVLCRFNSLAVQYAKALADDGIPVNAVTPGAVATDFTKGLDLAITRTPDEGADRGAAGHRRTGRASRRVLQR